MLIRTYTTMVLNITNINHQTYVGPRCFAGILVTPWLSLSLFSHVTETIL